MLGSTSSDIEFVAQPARGKQTLQVSCFQDFRATTTYLHFVFFLANIGLDACIMGVDFSLFHIPRC